MGRVGRVGILILGLWALAPIGGRAQGPERFSGPSSQSLLQLFDEYWEYKIAHHPEQGTGAGRREHNARWTDRSKEARDKEQYDLKEELQRAMWFSPGTLTPAMRLSAYLLAPSATSLRSDRNAARSSDVKRFGCSQAAKCPPFSTLL